MKDKIIEVGKISKYFGEIKAVDQIDFYVKEGEILGFLGPNGSGKTTTVRLLNGVLFPEKGNIKVKGLSTINDGNKIRKITGVLTESAALYESMSARENLEFFAHLYNINPREIPKRIDSLLEEFGLSKRQKNKVAEFSTGMKKKLSIARALIDDPEILFLDEPTTSLDPESARDLISYIKELNRERKLTIFVCTHNLAQAEDFCKRFIFLDKGRIIEEGTLGEIEKKYITSVEMEIVYQGGIDDAYLNDYKYKKLDSDKIIITIDNKKQVPQFIREISQKTDIYSINTLNSNLEKLYFEVRRVYYENAGNGSNN